MPVLAPKAKWDAELRQEAERARDAAEEFLALLDRAEGRTELEATR